MCSVGRGDVFSFWANVFSFWPDVFTFRPNVFTLAGEVFSFRRYALVGDGARKEGEIPSFDKLRTGFDKLRAGSFDRLRTGSSGDAGTTGMCSLGWGNVSCFGANVSSFWPDVFTFEGNVSSFCPNVSTLAGQVSSLAGQG